jgi:hypothetical protein
MKKLRGPVLAVALTLPLAVFGCAKKTEDPKAALAASTSGLNAGNYAFTAAMPDAQLTGVVHVPSKSAALQIDSKATDGPGKFEFRLVDPDRWVRMSIDVKAMTQGVDLTDPAMKPLVDTLKLFDGKTWMHVDLSKVKNADDLGLDLAKPDVTGASALLAGVVTAQGDKHTVTGTLDATKAGDEIGGFDTDDVKAMGEAAKSLPYSATLDDQGRLTHLELDVPKAGETPAGKWTLDLTGYGAQQPQTKPDGPVKEMPASGYEMLNN